MSEPFLFSIPSGEPVEIEPFHFAFIGQTQFSGKTTLAKRLAKWIAGLGYKVLIWDTKETESDYEGFGEEVPVCLRETTDSFVLIGLLESMFRRRLTPYYATLSRLSEGAKGFGDIIERAKIQEQRTKSSWARDAYRTLYDLLERLQGETAKVETVPQLQLPYPINRMVINDFSLEAQQLIIKNSFEDLLRVYKRQTIAIVDEAFKFLPQGYSSAATRAIMNVMTQGAKTGLYGWIATQFLAVTDKDPLKACAVKFLGTQDHITEIKHTLDLIPEARGKFTADDIMKLKLGHWILVRKRPMFVGIVYSLPAGVPKDIGRKVASGELTPEYVRDNFLKKKEVDEELVWKEKYEELIKKVEEIRLRAYEEGQASLSKDIVEDNKFLSDRVKELEDKIKDYEKEIKNVTVRLKRAEEDIKVFRDFRGILAKILPMPPVREGSEPSGPSEISVTTELPTISVKVEKKPLTLTDKDLLGKIALIYAEGEIDDAWFTVSNMTKMFQKHAWHKDPRTSGALDDLVRWGFLEKRFSGKRPEYRIRMSPTDAREKGLLKIEE